MDIQTSAWTDAQFAPYGIPAGTFTLLNLLTCPSPSHKPATTSKEPPFHEDIRKEKGRRGQDTFPLVLLSPGLGNPRLWYSALAQQVSSRGYSVVTIDHTYDAGIVVFPNGSAIQGANITTDEQIAFDLAVRVADVSFVLDQLSLASATSSLISGFGCSITVDTDIVGIFGHSLGGATAAQALLEDERLVGGVNLDGTFFGPLSNPSSSISTKKPFMMFAHDGKNLTTDASWASAWPKWKGWKRLLQVDGSAHGTFTDLPDVVDVLGLGGRLPGEVGELLGAIDGARAMSVLGTYLSAFFGMVLKDENEKLFMGPSTEWPEVVYLESDD